MVIYAVFCTINGPAIQVAVLKGKSDTALFYRDKALYHKMLSKDIRDVD